ncbi:hypothetical protein [Acetoanaerobium sticklandii]
MKIMKAFIRKGAAAFAFVALIATQIASTQFSLIYYQDSVPEKLK